MNLLFQEINLKARFNIAISDEGNYIPKGSYSIVHKSKSESIAHISNNLINQKRHKLTGNEINITRI